MASGFPSHFPILPGSMSFTRVGQNGSQCHLSTSTYNPNTVKHNISTTPKSLMYIFFTFSLENNFTTQYSILYEVKWNFFFNFSINKTERNFPPCKYFCSTVKETRHYNIFNSHIYERAAEKNSHSYLEFTLFGSV